MEDIQICTPLKLYAQRCDPVMQAIALACHRCLAPVPTTDQSAVYAWLGSHFKRRTPGKSCFFAAAVLPPTSGRPHEVVIGATLTGTQRWTKCQNSFPVAEVGMYEYFPDLPAALVPPVGRQLLHTFLRNTVEVQAYHQRMQQSELVAVTRAGEPNKVWLHQQRNGTFVRVRID